MKAFKPDDKLTVELDAQVWNVVLDHLHDGRYRVVAPIITSIGEQLQNNPGGQEVPHDNVIPMGAAAE